MRYFFLPGMLLRSKSSSSILYTGRKRIIYCMFACFRKWLFVSHFSALKSHWNRTILVRRAIPECWDRMYFLVNIRVVPNFADWIKWLVLQNFQLQRCLLYFKYVGKDWLSNMLCLLFLIRSNGFQVILFLISNPEILLANTELKW